MSCFGAGRLKVFPFCSEKRKAISFVFNTDFGSVCTFKKDKTTIIPISDSDDRKIYYKRSQFANNKLASRMRL